MSQFNALEWEGHKTLLLASTEHEVFKEVVPFIKKGDNSSLITSYIGRRWHPCDKDLTIGELRQAVVDQASDYLEAIDEPLASAWLTWVDDDDYRAPWSAVKAFKEGLALDSETDFIRVRADVPVYAIASRSAHQCYPPREQWRLALARMDFVKSLSFLPLNCSEDLYWYEQANGLAEKAVLVEGGPFTINAVWGVDIMHGQNTVPLTCSAYNQLTISEQLQALWDRRIFDTTFTEDSPT